MGNFNQQPPSRSDSTNQSLNGININFTGSTPTFPNNYIPAAAVTGNPFAREFSPGYYRAIAIQESTVQIINNAAEADLFTANVAAGLMGARGIAELLALCRHANTTGVARNCTLRLYFGGTAVFSFIVSIANGAVRYSTYCRLLVANKSANSQYLMGQFVHAAADDGGGAVVAAVTPTFQVQFNTLSKDTSILQAIKITGDLSTSGATEEVDCMYASASIIEP